MTDQLDPSGSTGGEVPVPPAGRPVAAGAMMPEPTDHRRVSGQSDATDQPPKPRSWPTATPPAAPTAGPADPAQAAPGPLFPDHAASPPDHFAATLPPRAAGVTAAAGQAATAEPAGRTTTTGPADAAPTALPAATATSATTAQPAAAPAPAPIAQPAAAATPTAPADPATEFTLDKSASARPIDTPWTGARAPFAPNLAPANSAVGQGVHSVGYGSAASVPVPEGPTRAALATDVVTCPECGQLATVDMARRQADDFCRRCDFPLFWARGTVIAPEGEESGASLRRLPGTVGRAATAALICPHCSEPNSPVAEICVRCALSLHPVDIAEPEPVLIPVPEPEPEPEPERGFDWWWVVAVVMALIAIGLVISLIYLR